MSVDVRRIPAIKRLASDYVLRISAVSRRSFPAIRPSVLHGRRRSRARKRTRDWPSELAAVIRAQQQRRGATGATVVSGAKLADPSTVAIVTGQQAGLFGGRSTPFSRR